jgi:hypothetical protein
MRLRRLARLTNRFTKNETHARAVALYYLTKTLRTFTTRRVTLTTPVETRMSDQSNESTPQHGPN